MKTRVFITTDVEFKIGGALSYGNNAVPIGESAVHCFVDGRANGLGFILTTLAEYGFRATFFVEALNCIYFGPDPMGKIAREIYEAGQDVQLHLHPCWGYFRHPQWREALREQKPNDNMAGRTAEEAEALIREGVHTFVQWRLPRPVALRTGNLQVDRNVYVAMKRIGVPIASNIGAGWWRPADPTLLYYSNPCLIEDIVEFPILTYLGFPVRMMQYQKILTIAGVSWSEMQILLWKARKAGVGAVTILTHPTEYILGTNDAFTGAQKNKVTQARLQKLCAFLSAHRDEFEVSTLGDVASQPRENTEGLENVLLTVPLWARLRGLVENKCSSLFSF